MSERKKKYQRITGYNKFIGKTGVYYCSYGTRCFVLLEDGSINKSNSFEPKIEVNNIDDIIDFDIQQKPTINGLYPEEVIAKIYSIPEVNINKIAILENISDLDKLQNTGDSDFMVAPIYKNNHFISAVVHFIDPLQNNGTDREIFVFDSEQKDNIPYIGIADGLIADPRLLNYQDLQGESGTCAYFTAEFIAGASKVNNFQALYDICKKGEIQHYVYDQVKEILNRNGKDLDKLRIGSSKQTPNSLDNENLGFGKLLYNQFLSEKECYNTQPTIRSIIQKTEDSHYWRNKIRKSKSAPNLSKTGHTPRGI